MNTDHRRLLRVAHRYAEQLRQRPNALGLALYGSLAVTEPPEITRFSDIDFALVLDAEALGILFPCREARATLDRWHTSIPPYSPRFA